MVSTTAAATATTATSTTATAGILLGGIAIGAVLAIASRGRLVPNATLTTTATATSSSYERVMATVSQEFQTLRHQIQQDIVREVNSSSSKTVSSLQLQERELNRLLNGHYQILQNRLKPVDQTRQELATMSLKMKTLEDIFLSPKKRGTFGELQLEDIIRNVFPASSYDFQSTLSNGKRPDCILRLPSPIGALCIDSKFPLDPFLETHQNGNPETTAAATANTTTQKIQDSLRKHIKDIATKYIIPGETAQCAILFLPSEYIFSTIVSDYPNLVLESNKQRVWLACPTTLMAVLTTLRGVVRGLTLYSQTNEMLEQVTELSKDLDRLGVRMEKAEKSVDVAKENLRLMHVSIEKIQRRKLRLDTLNGFADDKTLLTNAISTSTGAAGDDYWNDQEESITVNGDKQNTMTIG